MINKKAQGHVEIILSFVLFVGVLFFIFVFFNPFAETSEDIGFIDDIQEAFVDYTSTDIGKLSVVINPGGNCYDFDIRDYSSDPFIEVQEDAAGRKFSIYFYDSFSTIDKRIPGCPDAFYTLGIYSEEQVMGYGKIQQLADDYEVNYEALRNSIGITKDFSFSIMDFNRNVLFDTTDARPIPSGIEVEAKEYPIRAIDNNGRFKELILNIRAW